MYNFCMKLVIGLGNPGGKYQNNRHNVGFMFIDFLANKLDKLDQFDQSHVKLIKPQSFMNRSGADVKKIIAKWKLEIENLIVVHDDLDIPLGKFKIQKGTGPFLHGGITSIEDQLGTKDFWRVRIGIDNREPDNRIDGESYVLQDFTPEEQIIIQQVFPKIEMRLKIEFLNTA